MFECMCTVDPTVLSKLRPCRRRLVSADSSPLRRPVTGRTMAVQYDIITTDALPVRCGPRRLAPAGLRKEQTCVQEMLQGGQIEPSDSPWASPVVLVTKKDGSTRFCVDYHRLNTDDEGRLSLAPDRRFVTIVRKSSGFPPWTSQADIGRWQCRRSLNAKLRL